MIQSYPTLTKSTETLKRRMGVGRLFTMSPEARPRHPMQFIVALILVVIVAVGLGAGYYFASGSRGGVEVTWSVNPLQITFLAGSSGSAPDSFTCNVAVAPVTLRAFSTQPSIITLTASSSGFSSCGSTPDSVVVTAACAADIPMHACPGDYSGQVVVCGPTPYTCLSEKLSVVIKVTQ